ncbi:Gamma-glutamylcyclotransferase [Paramyrothecium foliicola]|nr:Gamma-glutamylcyclotransferase [Paramyrothecium foliicola]
MQTGHRKLYFAYGSNLCLEQMATRCPNSQYVGRAILTEHRWHINSRGYANIVQSSGYNVHGLVYDIDSTDEARLDKSEGVSTGAYSKSLLSVTLRLASAELRTFTEDIIDKLGRLRSGLDSGPEQTDCLQVQVLVYLNQALIKDGEAKDEYVHRMNRGIVDAISLGIPEEYFENIVRPTIPREVPHRYQKRTRRNSVGQTPRIVLVRRTTSLRPHQRFEELTRRGMYPDEVKDEPRTWSLSRWR